MELGFYRLHGTWYDSPLNASKGIGGLACVGAVDAGTSETSAADRAANLTLVAKKLVNKGKRRLIVDLENGFRLGVKPTLKALAPVWGSVDRVMLAGEAPDLDYHALVPATRRKIELLGLEQRPIGALFTPDDIFGHDARMWGPLDWVGIEAYTARPTAEPNPGKAVGKKLERMAAKIGDGMPLVVVAQAFDCNSSFTNVEKILSVNQATWDFANSNSQVVALIGFRWNQSGGVRDYPALRQFYKDRSVELVVG